MARNRARTEERPVEPVVVSSLPERTSQRKFYVWGFTALMAILVVTTLVMMSITSSSPIAQPGQQVEEQTPLAGGNPPAEPDSASAQSKSEVVGPTAPVVVDYQVAWTEVRDFDPSTIPVEEGFYNGRMSYAFAPHLSTRDYSASIPVKAWEILPRLEGLAVAIAAARDQTDTDIVFASFEADRHGAYLLLSVDEEKSWCILNLLPAHIWAGKLRDHGDATAVRVVADGEEIHLYGKDPRPGNHWWTATVKKSELPCF